jgi:hypothetical protein
MPEAARATGGRARLPVVLLEGPRAARWRPGEAPAPAERPALARHPVAAAPRSSRMRAIVRASSSPAATSAYPAVARVVRRATEERATRQRRAAQRLRAERRVRAAHRLQAERRVRAAHPLRAAPQPPGARPARAEHPEPAERRRATQVSARDADRSSDRGAARATRRAAVPRLRGCRTPAAESVHSERNRRESGIASPGGTFEGRRDRVTAGCRKQANERNKRTLCPGAIDAAEGGIGRSPGVSFGKLARSAGSRRGPESSAGAFPRPGLPVDDATPSDRS